MERDAFGCPPRRRCFPRPFQYLPGPDGQFRRDVLIPEYTRGTRRKANPAGRKMANAMTAARKRGDRATVRKLRSSGAACRTGILVILATAGSAISGTPMTISSGSPARKPKPSKSGSARPVPARRTQAGTVSGQDADHPRPYPEGAVPRLRHHRPALPTRPAVNGVMGLRVPQEVVTARQAPYRTTAPRGTGPAC